MKLGVVLEVTDALVFVVVTEHGLVDVTVSLRGCDNSLELVVSDETGTDVNTVVVPLRKNPGGN